MIGAAVQAIGELDAAQRKALAHRVTRGQSRTLLLATRSAGKLRELGPMIRGAGYEPRDARRARHRARAGGGGGRGIRTFEENSLAKARYYFTRAARSARARPRGARRRFGPGGARARRRTRRAEQALVGGALEGQALDDANNAKLMAALRGAATGARATCASRRSRARMWSCTRAASVAESMLESPRGADGFGYDPYFFSEEFEEIVWRGDAGGEGGGESSRAGGARGARSVSRWRVKNEFTVFCWSVFVATGCFCTTNEER